jgi:AcrR family transcriptional regulator
MPENMSQSPDSFVSLRELTRRAVRSQITERATALFMSQGFTETTLDQIAASVGISTRSVSRYFKTKEDIVVGHLLEIGHRVGEALEARPVGEDARVALRRALDVSVISIVSDESGLAKMSIDTPALRSAMVEKHRYWQQLLAPRVARRLPKTPGDTTLQAQAIVAAGMACLDVAAEAWADSEGADLGALLDEAFAAVRG